LSYLKLSYENFNVFYSEGPGPSREERGWGEAAIENETLIYLVEQ